MDTWQINNDGDRVIVIRNGAWFADASDVDDAVGICQGQRAREATIDDLGYIEHRRLW